MYVCVYVPLAALCVYTKRREEREREFELDFTASARAQVVVVVYVDSDEIARRVKECAAIYVRVYVRVPPSIPYKKVFLAFIWGEGVVHTWREGVSPPVRLSFYGSIMEHFEGWYGLFLPRDAWELIAGPTGAVTLFR